MDFDPRDYADGRERDGFEVHELCWGDDALALDGRERDLDRERDPEHHDPRDPFVDGLELPRSAEREFVQDRRENLYELNREDSLMLATIGAFRVVRERDLNDFPDAERTLEHLRDEGLIQTVQIGPEERADVLTTEGRSVLEANRDDLGDDLRSNRDEDRQAFYAGVSRARELQHDSDLFRAYREVEKELRGKGAEVQRIVLEVDLRREYQQWLQEHNRGRANSDGRPDRTDRERQEWARDHELPFRDDKVQFPDFRIEYELEGRDRHEDVEIVTDHYRGGHLSAKSGAGFTCIRGGSTSHGGAPFDPDIAEDLV